MITATYPGCLMSCLTCLLTCLLSDVSTVVSNVSNVVSVLKYSHITNSWSRSLYFQFNYSHKNTEIKSPVEISMWSHSRSPDLALQSRLDITFEIAAHSLLFTLRINQFPGNLLERTERARPRSDTHWLGILTSHGILTGQSPFICLHSFFLRLEYTDIFTII